MAGVIAYFHNNSTLAQVHNVTEYVAKAVQATDGIQPIAFIDVVASSSQFAVAYGCTDTELEAHLLSELLVHNFGFGTPLQCITEVEVSVTI